MYPAENLPHHPDTLRTDGPMLPDLHVSQVDYEQAQSEILNLTPIPDQPSHRDIQHRREALMLSLVKKECATNLALARDLPVNLVQPTPGTVIVSLEDTRLINDFFRGAYSSITPPIDPDMVVLETSKLPHQLSLNGIIEIATGRRVSFNSKMKRIARLAHDLDSHIPRSKYTTPQQQFLHALPWILPHNLGLDFDPKKTALAIDPDFFTLFINAQKTKAGIYRAGNYQDVTHKDLYPDYSRSPELALVHQYFTYDRPYIENFLRNVQVRVLQTNIGEFFQASPLQYPKDWVMPKTLTFNLPQ